jgi:hypothetical protein
VYRWRSRAHPSALRRELAAVDWLGYWLDGRRVADAAALHERCAALLSFPAWFGHDWTGLVDCLGDLSWLPAGRLGCGDGPVRGQVVLWDGYGTLAASDGLAWRRGYEAFETATAVRVRYRLSPLYLLLRGAGPAGSPVLAGTPIPLLATP